MEGIIPVCLVTGFLGSGKTTLLKQILAQNQTKRLAFLINEFSPRDIDSAIVSAEHPDVISVPGGSIFCKCLVTEFIQQMQAIPTRFPDIDGVVIEASGMANPTVIHTMLAETHLDQQYRIARIVTVVDPGSFHKLVHTLPGITAQIETADLALLNKADQHNPDALARTEEALHAISPGIQILPTTFCQAHFDLFPAVSPPATEGGTYALCKDPAYETRSFSIRQAVEPAVMEKNIAPAASDLYRLKGFITKPDGSCWKIDWTVSGFDARPADQPHTPSIVLLHKGDPSPALAPLLAFFERLQQNP